MGNHGLEIYWMRINKRRAMMVVWTYGLLALLGVALCEAAGGAGRGRAGAGGAAGGAGRGGRAANPPANAGGAARGNPANPANAAAPATMSASDALTFFEAKIRPVLSKNCYECH